jgi:hypothetical protein
MDGSDKSVRVDGAFLLARMDAARHAAEKQPEPQKSIQDMSDDEIARASMVTCTQGYDAFLQGEPIHEHQKYVSDCLGELRRRDSIYFQESRQTALYWAGRVKDELAYRKHCQCTCEAS